MSRLDHTTPLYKFEVTCGLGDRVVFARDAQEADDIAAALAGEPQRTQPGRRSRRMHHPRLRGGLREFTYGERLAEAHLRLRSPVTAVNAS